LDKLKRNREMGAAGSWHCRLSSAKDVSRLPSTRGGVRALRKARNVDIEQGTQLTGAPQSLPALEGRRLQRDGLIPRVPNDPASQAHQGYPLWLIFWRPGEADTLDRAKGVAARETGGI
jgi:hypothetical protein